MVEATADTSADGGRPLDRGWGPPMLGGLQGEEAAKETEREGSERQETKRRGDWRGSCPLEADGHPHLAPCWPQPFFHYGHGSSPRLRAPGPGPGSALLVTAVLRCGRSWCAASNVRYTRHPATATRVRVSGSPLGHLPSEPRGHHPKPESFSWKR